MSSKDVPGWDGEQSGWYDFVRRTWLFFERTSVHKRYLVGPEIASKLSGKAWTITHELDFEKLTKDDDTAYLLKYLEHRLCKTPVPETGQKLEELFIRLRRPQGMAMAQWATEVREAYTRPTGAGADKESSRKIEVARRVNYVKEDDAGTRTRPW